jgi:multidrug resistance efflux pump
MKKIGILLVLVVSLLILTACSGSNSTPEVVEEATILAPVQAESGTIVEGKIVPKQYAELSFAMSGSISEVLVKEGESVEGGEVIARLEGRERLEAAISGGELGVLSAEQALDQLYEDADVRRANAQLALAQTKLAYDTALERLESKDFKRGTQDEIDAAYAGYILAVEKVKDEEEDFEDFALKAEDDWGRAQALAELAAARDEKDRAWQRLTDLEGLPDAFELGEAQAELEVAEANMEKSQEDWDLLAESGIDPDDLVLAEARLKDAEAQLASARASLDDLELIAPFNGVLARNTLEVGELVNPGSVSVALADETEWEVETTDLTELDVIGIEEGSEVAIAVDAIPDLELSGIVTQVNVFGVNKQGDITYKVSITLDKGDDRLRWNMTTEVIFEENKD